MYPRYTLDVAHLPAVANDQRAVVWWGNTLMMVIESTSVMLLIAAYFFSRQNFSVWPPPFVDKGIPYEHAYPELFWGTLNTLLMLASLAPAIWTDVVSRRFEQGRARIGLYILFAISVASLAIRMYEFPSLIVRWDSNAYGSLTWAILGFHWVYLVAGVLENFAIALWLTMHKMDVNHVIDVTLTLSYWYWVVGIWLPMYAVIYWVPRLL
jgi:heme/copper-type cytochrome/quinol oxidase subunit 3